MDGKQGPQVVASMADRGDEALQDVLGDCDRTLRNLRPAEDYPRVLAQYRRLNELNSALDALETWRRLAVVLAGTPGVTSGPAASPMHPSAVERLRRATNVVARRDT